jgi:hypothetical protein
VLIELVNDESKLATSVADDTLLTLVDVHELHLVRQDSKGQEQWLTNERSQIWAFRIKEPEMGY